MTLAIAIQIDGYDPSAGAAVSLRACSANHPEVCHLDGQTWWPVIATSPTLAYDLFDGSFTGAIETPAGSFALAIEPWANFGRYQLSDARVRLWTGEIGSAWASWTLRFDGRTTGQPAIGGGIATVPIAVDDRWLDKPLLATYAGTGGAEGVAGLKGSAKPLALGAPRYAPGTLIDPTNSILQLSAYGSIEDVEGALERLVRFGASAGDYASYAALAAATVPAGRWATAKAVGMVRHGAPPTGKLSYLIRGDKAGAGGWARLPGALIRRIAEIAGEAGRLDLASLAALDAARPWPLSIYLDAQITPREIIQRIAASVNAVAGTSWLGKLFVVPVGIGAPSVTLRSDGAALPPVGAVAQAEASPPWWRLSLQAARTWAVHSLDEIAFNAQLIDLGAYAAGTTYREGNMVQQAGSSWVYINPTPSAGNAPPTLPTESNAWWKVIARAGADGSSSYTPLLSNETHVLPADADGDVLSYDGAATEFSVFAGGTDVTASFALSVVSNPQALTIGISGNTATVTGGLDAGEPNASVLLRMTGSGSYAGVTLERQFSLVKSRAGADGESPPLIRITATPQIARYTGAGAFVPGQTITFKAAATNAAGVPIFRQLTSDGTEVYSNTAAGYAADSPDNWSSPDPETLVLSAAGLPIVIAEHGGPNGRFTMRATIASAPDIFDEVSVQKVQDGAAGASAFTLVATPGNNVTPNSAIKADTATSGGWSRIATTAESFTGGAVSSFVTNGAMLGEVLAGLDDGPGVTYDDLRYSWLSNNYAGPNCHILSEGVVINSMPLSAGDRLSIDYDGAGKVTWRQNGITRHVATVAANQTLFFAAHAVAVGNVVSGITFAARGASGADGLDGADGLPGAPGADGVSQYVHIAYANSADGSVDFTTGSPGSRSYIGTAVDTNPADPTAYGAYTWSKYRGDDGAPGTDGLPGAPGADGTPRYIWIAYANSADGSVDFTTGAPGGRTYIGVAPNKTTAVEGTTASDYGWSLIKGADGAAGAPGAPGADGDDALSASGLSAIVVNAYNDGTLVPDALAGASGQMKVLRGKVDVTAGCTYAVSGQVNCTVSVNATGGYTVTSVGPAAKAEAIITASYGGLSIPAKLSISKAIRGAGSYSASSALTGSTNSATYGLMTGAITNAPTTDPLGVLITANFAYAISSGSQSITAKIQYAINGGTWTDLPGSEAEGGAAFAAGPEPSAISLSGTLGDTALPANAALSLRVQWRKTAGTGGTITTDGPGTMTMQWQGGLP